MKSLSLFAFLFLAVTARAETTTYSIGEIDNIIKAEAPTPAVIQPTLPTTVSEFYFLPARGQTAAQLSFAQLNGATNGNSTEGASDFDANVMGITIDRSIANNFFLNINVQNQSMTTAGDTSFQKFGLGFTKVAPINKGNILLGARLATYVSDEANGDSFDMYQAIPFLGFEQTSRGAAWGGELAIDQYLRNVVDPTDAVFMGTAFYEVPAAQKVMIGSKAGLNMTDGQMGYVGGLYTKYQPLPETDIKLAVETSSVHMNIIEKTTAVTLGLRRTL